MLILLVIFTKKLLAFFGLISVMVPLLINTNSKSIIYKLNLKATTSNRKSKEKRVLMNYEILNIDVILCLFDIENCV